jgi:hypothetical protein
MFTNTDAEPAPYQENSRPRGATRSRPTTADATLEFGQFRVLLRRRQLVADGMPIELGTRAFDLLLVLLDADGSLVTKGELLSRVWPGTRQLGSALAHSIAKRFGKSRIVENPDLPRTKKSRHFPSRNRLPAACR